MKHLEIARTQIGVHEIPKGSNKGPDIKKYLNSVGLDEGYSWCMAFVYWCCKQAYSSNPLVKTGGVLAQWNKIDKKHRAVHPKVGDIFIMDFGGGLGHTGFVTAIEGNNIHTIEGNSNDEGSREGSEVCERTRKISAMKGFIRI